MNSILVTMNNFRQFLTRSEKLSCIKMIMLSMFVSLFELIMAAMIVMFARVLANPDIMYKYIGYFNINTDMSVARLTALSAIFLGVGYFIKNILSSLQTFYQNFSVQNMNYRFKTDLLSRYSQLDYSLYLTRNSSKGMQVLEVDVEKSFTLGMIALADIFSESIIFLSLVILVIYMNPILALILFSLASSLGFVAVKFMFPRFYQFGRVLQMVSLNAHHHLMQFFHGFKEILVLDKRDIFINHYKREAHKQTKTMALQSSFNSMPRMTIEIVFVGSFVAAVIFLSFQHQRPEHLIATLGAYLYTGFRLMPGLNRLFSQVNVFKMSLPHIERVCCECTELNEKGEMSDVPELTFNESLSFNNVSFQYLNTNKEVLSGITFKINKGDRVGIVGETGSGKSTLVDLMLGLLKPQQGSIKLDALFPVNSLQWRKKVGYVPQSIYLIDDSIKRNIAFGESVIDMDALNCAIDAAQLRYLVDRLPDKLETVVGERGVRLSGGERQRVAIARALYHNPEVLIFDEATSALDHVTETRLIKTIHAVSKDRTVVMIAHRLSTLEKCDRILVMESGRIKSIITDPSAIQDHLTTKSV